MAINDNWHMCPGVGCHHTQIAPSPFLQVPMPAGTPRCPATERHVRRWSAEATGLQCKYAPDHDGDHCAFAGPGEGDVFWPQEAAVAAKATEGTGM